MSAIDRPLAERSIKAEPAGLQRLTLSGLGFIVATFLFYMLMLYIGGGLNAKQHDFVTYWTSAKLFLAHTNPYDADAVRAIERAMGNTHKESFVMRNPPWMLLLVAPLGLFSLQTAAALWTFILMVLTALTLIMIRAPKIAWFFIPLTCCILVGQSTIFVLFGVAVFFRFQEKRPALAGLALVLLLIKPHLLLLFWPILLIWSIQCRQFKIFALAVPAGLILTSIVTYLDPHAWSQYLAMMRGENIEAQHLPNISSAVRMFVSAQHAWIQLIPSCLGVLWAMSYYIRNQKDWQWNTHGPLLVAASTLASPYSWYYDQTLFIPDITDAAKHRKISLSVFLSMILLPAVLMCFHFTWKSPIYAVCAVSWFGWRIRYTITRASVKD